MDVMNLLLNPNMHEYIYIYFLKAQKYFYAKSKAK